MWNFTLLLTGISQRTTRILPSEQTWFEIFHGTLTYFIPLTSFLTPWKHQKTRCFLMFSGCIEKRPVVWDGLTYSCIFWEKYLPLEWNSIYLFNNRIRNCRIHKKQFSSPKKQSRIWNHVKHLRRNG